MDERNLVMRAQAGDKEAFAGLVDRCGRLVLSLATCYLGSAEAPDAAQEIWLAVYRKLWQLEEGDRFRPWLKKVVFYQCINYSKAHTRRTRRETTLGTETWLALVECVADDACGAPELVERREVGEQIARALDTLPGEYGLLLRLHYLQGQGYGEIAKVTGLPLSTVKWRLHQGRQLLRTCLVNIIGKGHGRA